MPHSLLHRSISIAKLNLAGFGCFDFGARQCHTSFKTIQQEKLWPACRLSLKVFVSVVSWANRLLSLWTQLCLARQ